MEIRLVEVERRVPAVLPLDVVSGARNRQAAVPKVARRLAMRARRSILIGFGVAPKRKSTTSSTVVPPVLRDPAALAAAFDALAGIDAAFMATLDAATARPGLRTRAPGFEGLAAIIVSQQVSTASANAIFGRLKARLGEVEAQTLASVTDDDLRGCGLSAPKIRTLRAIAAAIEEGALDFAALAAAEAEAAHGTLCAIRGIGPWTADVFLLFCLGHADAWPAGDLALQEGARLALGLTARPTTDELRALGERWRPLRGAAAYCLWAYYGAVRRRAATLEDAAPSPPASSVSKTRMAKPPAPKASPAKLTPAKLTPAKLTPAKLTPAKLTPAKPRASAPPLAASRPPRTRKA